MTDAERVRVLRHLEALHQFFGTLRTLADDGSVHVARLVDELRHGAPPAEAPRQCDLAAAPRWVRE